MKKIPYFLEQIINSVVPNTSERFNCPVCHGSNTLSVTKENGTTKWNCYKNICTLHGNGTYLDNAHSLRQRLERRTAAKQEFQLPPYLIHGVASEKCLQMLLKGNCLVPYQKQLFSVAYDPAQDRICFLVKKNNKVVGMIGKAIKSKSKPKVLNYENSSEEIPFLVGNTPILVMVEDCLSAASITRISELSGMALLGTELKETYIPLLKQYKTLIIALDKDTGGKPLDLRGKLRYYHPDVRIWLLQKDIKDMNDSELKDAYARQQWS